MSSGVWKHCDFRKLWIGQSISELGSRVTREGVPWTAVQLLGATPFQMSLLATLGGVSVMFVSLLAGVWVERLRRRPLLILSDLGRAILLATIPFAAYRHVLGMAQLYVVVALAGALTVLFDVAYQTYVPDLLEKEQLAEGNSKLALTGAIAEVLGPGITGVLVQTITAPIAILLDACSFLVSALSVALIRKAEKEPEPVVAESVFGLTVAGLAHIKQDPILRLLAARAMTFFFFGGFFGSLYILYAVRDLHLSPVLLGIVVASGGGGNLLGALISQRIGTRFGLGRTFLYSSILSGIAVSLLPLAHGAPLVAASFLIAQQMLGDSATVVYFVNETTLRQTITPERLLGRVNAGMHLVSRGIYPLGTLLGGIVAEYYGVRQALWVGSTGVLLSTIWLLGGPLRRLKAMPDPESLTLLPGGG